MPDVRNSDEDSAHKLTSALREQLTGAEPQTLLQVAVEVRGVPAPTRDVASARAAFERVAGPLADRIEELGGKVVASAWINHTLKASVPAGRLEHLASLDAVAAIDVLHRLESE
jgi:hypothetical protein